MDGTVKESGSVKTIFIMRKAGSVSLRIREVVSVDGRPMLAAWKKVSIISRATTAIAKHAVGRSAWWA